MASTITASRTMDLLEAICRSTANLGNLKMAKPKDIPMIPKIRFGTQEEIFLMNNSESIASEASKGSQYPTRYDENSKAGGEELGAVLSQLQELSIHCAQGDELTDKVQKCTQELERVTKSIEKMNLKAYSFENEVQAGVEAKVKESDSDEQGRIRTVHSLEMKLSRAKEKQLLQRQWQQEHDAQQILKAQIQGARAELEKMKRISEETQERLSQAHNLWSAEKEAPREGAMEEENGNGSQEGGTSAASSPSDDIDKEEVELQNQCKEIRSGIERFEASLANEKNAFLDRAKQIEGKIAQEMKEARESKAKKAEAARASEPAPQPPADSSSGPSAAAAAAAPVDGFVANIRERLLEVLEEKAERRNPVATAMKIILDHDGAIPQNKLKKELREKLADPSKVTTAIYSLMGLSLVRKDRADPKNIFVVSCF